MKKQFFRVKQLADQTFSRAGKTEVLSDDLQAADKRVEFIRQTCQNTGKKLGSLLQAGQGQEGPAREKRLRKNGEHMLGAVMVECGALEEDCLLRDIVQKCGCLQQCLANEYVDYEASVESHVLAALHQVSDVDVPNIIKYKRNLAKLILDMDSARTRYQTAMNHNSSSQGKKVESIRDELEEAESKVEQCRDSLACEMFQLIAKEAELAKTMLEYARLQRSYHQAAIASLDEVIPQLESTIQNCSVKPVFGVSLEEHLRVTGRKVAYPMELCVCALSMLAMDEEGLFRVAGGASKIRRMKLSLDANCLSLATALEYRDPHVIASVLKSYLRQLPEPLMTQHLHDQWVAAAKVTESNDAKLQALWNVVQQLPTPNLDNLRYLVKFLALLSQNQEVNKMTPQNIAIVVAPNLLWSPNDDSNNIGANMNTASLHSIILDSLVSYSDWFFPGEQEMFLTLSRWDVDGGFRDHLMNGHTRSGSGDTNLINTTDAHQIGRSQSNSSLTDDQSPPHGSPKPMTRNRKSKPAPVPPGGQSMRESVVYGKDSNRDYVILNKESKTDESSQVATSDPDELSEISERLLESETKSEEDERRHIAEESERRKKLEEYDRRKKLEEAERRKNKEESLQSQIETAVKRAEEDVNKNIEEVVKKKAEGLPLEKNVEEVKVQSEPKSVIKSKEESATQRSGDGAPAKPPKPELVYSTLDRKRQSRPTPAPRTSLADAADKPVIPERPATLQRPLSSSFRISRNLSDSSAPDEGPVSLERAHVYSVDKQQVSIIQVSGDKEKDSRNPDKKEWDKPDRPPKPDVMTHKRTASEGNIVDTGISLQKSPVSTTRPPRPTPPPPPAPKCRESTDL